MVARSRSFYLLAGIIALILLSSLSFSSPRATVSQFGHRFADNIVGLAASASTCPNPYASTTNTPTSLATVAAGLPPSAECTSLSTVSDEFTVSACRHTSYCSALDIIITRTNGELCAQVEQDMHADPVSNDTQLTDFVRNSLGPDGFMLIVDGAERMARYMPDAYLGSCSYRYSLRFNNAGPISLQIWNHYNHYYTYWENNYEWPPQATTKVLLTNPLYFDVCPTCRPYVAPPSSVNATQVFDTSSGQHPQCSYIEPVYGSYIPISYLEAHDPQDFSAPLPANQNAYKFVPAGNCRFTHAGLRYTDHGACFSLPETSVRFRGDSHMRVIFDGIAHRLEGNQYTMTESEKSGHKNASFANRYLDFLWDPTAEGLLWSECDEMRDYDVLGFSVGHHLHRMTTEEYTEHMRAIFDHITSLSASCPTTSGRTRRLVYISPPAVAPREDSFVREIKDRRTNIRITNWTSIGLEMARTYGWRSVDQFALTSAFVRDVKDYVHFIETDGMDSVLDDVIAKIGIC